MTLHINEVSIQMRVRDGSETAGSGKAAGSVGSDPCGCPLSEEQVEEIVAQSVRRTLAALRSLKDR